MWFSFNIVIPGLFFFKEFLVAFLKIFILFIYLIYFFGCVGSLVEACGVFIEACGIFHCGVGSSLWHAGFSLVVACRFSLSSCGTRAPGRMGGTRALSLRHVSSVVVALRLSCPVACGILVP